MKIQGSQGPTAPPIEVGRRRPPGVSSVGTEGSEASGARASNEQGVSVRVSETAARRGASALAAPSFDAARVERLRAAVESGTLAVDAAAVARGMLPDEE